MATPATEDLRELERLLLVAQETGEAMSEARLQEEIGVGHADLQGMLGTLREVGKAMEETPGEWIAGYGVPDTPGDGERVVVSGEDPGEADGPPGAGHTTLDTQSLQFFEQQGPRVGARVLLTRAMIAALEPQALGALIAAGVAGCADDEAFRFEVTP